MPERARIIASATSCTASSWPITRSCRISSRRSSFSRSPSWSHFYWDAGPSGHDRGYLVLGHDLAQQPLAAAMGSDPLFLGRQPACCKSGQPAKLLVRLPCSGRTRAPPGRLPAGPAPFLRAAPGLGAMFAARLLPSSKCVCLGAKICQLLAQTSRGARGWLDLPPSPVPPSSISSLITRLVSSSSSAGMESISVRMTAYASSTRSIALSGRKRSDM